MDKISESRIFNLKDSLHALAKSFIWFTRGARSMGRNPKGQKHVLLVGVTPPLLERLGVVPQTDCGEGWRGRTPAPRIPQKWPSAGWDRQANRQVKAGRIMMAAPKPKSLKSVLKWAWDESEDLTPVVVSLEMDSGWCTEEHWRGNLLRGFQAYLNPNLLQAEWCW